MTMTIGRATGLREGSIGREGDARRFAGTIIAASNAELDARIQQLEGLVDNPDEPVVPVTSTVDSNLDGFYFVRGVSVSPVGVEGGTRARFIIDVVRVGGYSTPQFEWIITQMFRTNVHGVLFNSGTAPGGVWAVPSSAVELNPGGFPYVYTRTADDGALTVLATNGSVGTTYFGSYFLPPASRYQGMCKIEVLYGGTYYPVTGTQIPAGATWRLSNGLLRVTASGGTITVSPYDGTQWDPAGSFQMGATAVAQTLTFSTPRIIRNSPERVVIRLSAPGSLGLSAGANVLDITLSAGQRHAEFSLVSFGQTDWYVEPTPGIASTALTAGLIATSIDANGNRFQIHNPVAQSNNLATGRVKLNASASVFDFMIAYEVNTATVAAQDAHVQVLNKYFQVIGSRQSIVVR